jgi:hypothetical protein
MKRLFMPVAILSVCLSAPVSAQSISHLAMGQDEKKDTESGAESRASIRFRIAGSTAFNQETELPVREALLIDTLSVFIGKTGLVRTRGGTVAAFVILSSQELGCGRIQYAAPSVVVLGRKRAEEFAKRLEPTRPHPTAPYKEFVPADERDFEVKVLGLWRFDPKEMDKNREALPFTYQVLEGKQGNWVLGYPEFTVGVLDREAPEKGHVKEFKNRDWLGQWSNWQEMPWKTPGELPKKSPWLFLTLKDGHWSAKIEAEDKTMSLSAELPVKKCPALEHIHIEPK